MEEEILSMVSALAAGHPGLIGGLAIALLLTSAANAATSGYTPEKLTALEAERPRLAGAIYLLRGAGLVAHWVLRGLALLIAPARVLAATLPAAEPATGGGQ